MTTPAPPERPIAATRNDWRDLKPMTEMPVLMPLYIPFTEAQMANIRLGYVPVAMEEKWFAYFADSGLHIYRSWTGFYMFRIHFEPRADGWRATHAEINMDPAYFNGSLEEARGSLLAELGKAVIRYFDLDPDYYDGENLSCIVSEGLAGVSLQIGSLISKAVKDAHCDMEVLLERLQVLEAFVAAVLLGTNTVYMPGRTLKDYVWERAAAEVETDEGEVEERAADADEWRADEPEPEPGPSLHPRLDEHGKPVKLGHPSTPTKLSAWYDPGKTAMVIPDGPMPTEINGLPFLSWANAPTTDLEWKSVQGQMADLVEPTFHVGSGKHAAAGVVVEEADGRVWIVHPSNGFGGYSATFPKGRVDAAGLPLQVVAIREALEESGLQVQITGFLADSQRTMTTTRYYLARRVGGVTRPTWDGSRKRCRWCPERHWPAS